MINILISFQKSNKRIQQEFTWYNSNSLNLSKLSSLGIFRTLKHKMDTQFRFQFLIFKSLNLFLETGTKLQVLVSSFC